MLWRQHDRRCRSPSLLCAPFRFHVHVHGVFRIRLRHGAASFVLLWRSALTSTHQNDQSQRPVSPVSGLIFAMREGRFEFAPGEDCWMREPGLQLHLISNCTSINPQPYCDCLRLLRRAGGRSAALPQQAHQRGALLDPRLTGAWQRAVASRFCFFAYRHQRPIASDLDRGKENRGQAVGEIGRASCRERVSR